MVRWPNVTGCASVYLDLGANIGMHARFFFEPDRYPDRFPAVDMDEHLTDIKAVFSRFFGDANERRRPFFESNICYFGFEANPRHATRLGQLQKAYQKRGWKIELVAPMAVWDDDSEQVKVMINDVPDRQDWTTFVIPSQDSRTSLSLKETSFKYHQEQFGKIRPPKNNQSLPQLRISNAYLDSSVNIPAFSLPNFLEYLREVRAEQYSVIERVVAKFDLEGGEWRVLHSLLAKNLLCQKTGLDAATIEFHRDAHEIGADRNHLNETEELWKNLLLQRWIVGDEQCESWPTELIKVDTEAYVNDEFPI